MYKFIIINNYKYKNDFVSLKFKNFSWELLSMFYQILSKDHPQFHSKEIKAYEYGTCFNEVDSFDLVYHSAVMCQVQFKNKTGLQPVSRPEEQILVFSKS